MHPAVEDLRWRYDSEGAIARALVDDACERSGHIRRRLAAVAQDLRQAAATAGSGSEGLLKLASKFELHSRPGDAA
jgi:hypothetical protein